MSEPTVPPAARQPQDRRPKTAVQAEADGDPTVDVEWEGLTFTVPASVDDWPIAALDHYEMDRGLAFLRELLGAKQFAQFTAGGNRKARDANSLAAAIQKKAGYGEPGE